MNRELSTIYYRLKQVDYNGDFEYSPVRTLNSELKTSNSISVFPNPAPNQVYISTNTIVQTVRVFNLQGQLVLADNDRVINITSLPAGQYLIEVQSGAQLMRQFLVKE